MTFLPSREADLIQWSRHFDELITADPLIYGLDAVQAAAYAALHTAFTTAYQTAADNNTRTPSAIQAKNDAKAALIAEARSLVGIIQSFPGTTNELRSDLGITVPDDEPTPVPVPGTAPGIAVDLVVGRTVTLRLSDRGNPESRGKPDGVDGATVFAYFGPTPPAPSDTDAWTFKGNTGRTTTEIAFPPEIESGATAWFTAFWFNTRKQSGPAAMPISTQIPGSLPQAA